MNGGSNSGVNLIYVIYFIGDAHGGILDIKLVILVTSRLWSSYISPVSLVTSTFLIAFFGSTSPCAHRHVTALMVSLVIL